MTFLYEVELCSPMFSNLMFPCSEHLISHVSSQNLKIAALGKEAFEFSDWMEHWIPPHPHMSGSNGKYEDW